MNARLCSRANRFIANRYACFSVAESLPGETPSSRGTSQYCQSLCSTLRPTTHVHVQTHLVEQQVAISGVPDEQGIGVLQRLCSKFDTAMREHREYALPQDRLQHGVVEETAVIAIGQRVPFISFAEQHRKQSIDSHDACFLMKVLVDCWSIGTRPCVRIVP